MICSKVNFTYIHTYIRDFVHLHTGLKGDKAKRGAALYDNKSHSSLIKILTLLSFHVCYNIWCLCEITKCIRLITYVPTLVVSENHRLRQKSEIYRVSAGRINTLVLELPWVGCSNLVLVRFTTESKQIKRAAKYTPKSVYQGSV